jgi:hypothetical protein
LINSKLSSASENLSSPIHSSGYRSDLSLMARNCGVGYRFMEMFASIADG